jgi:hypothetical protein
VPAIATQQELDVRSAAWSDDDAKVDEALLGSFPASDSPPWTLGVIARPFRTHRCEDGSAKETACGGRVVPEAEVGASRTPQSMPR